MSGQQGHTHAQGGQQGGGGAEDASGHSHSHSHSHGHGHSHGGKGKGCTGFLLTLVGLDRFTKPRAAAAALLRTPPANPFDAGTPLSNCRDFWTKGGELGVDYERVYDVPGEGFLKRRMEGERGDLPGGAGGMDGGGNRGGKLGLVMGMAKARRYIPGFLGGSGGGGRTTYQALNMTEDV